MNRRFLTGKEGLALLALAAVLLAWLLWPKAAGATVVLKRGGEELGRYALHRPAEVTVAGANGFSLVLVIEEGAARVEQATCPDLICQRHAPISKAGESIICLPGQIAVTLEGGEGHGPDAYTG